MYEHHAEPRAEAVPERAQDRSGGGNDDAHVSKRASSGAQGGVHVRQALRGMGHVPVAAGNDRASIRTGRFQRGREPVAVPVAPRTSTSACWEMPDAVVQGIRLRHRGMAHRISLGDHAPGRCMATSWLHTTKVRACSAGKTVYTGACLAKRWNPGFLEVQLQQFGGLEEMPGLFPCW